MILFQINNYFPSLTTFSVLSHVTFTSLLRLFSLSLSLFTLTLLSYAYFWACAEPMLLMYTCSCMQYFLNRTLCFLNLSKKIARLSVLSRFLSLSLIRPLSPFTRSYSFSWLTLSLYCSLSQKLYIRVPKKKFVFPTVLPVCLYTQWYMRMRTESYSIQKYKGT